MSATPPTPVLTPGRVPELVARLQGGPGLLLGLDFDGTLAPIADDPSSPHLTPACRAALARFVDASSARVAVISGRSLADLRPRVALDGVIYAGNHGLERWWRDRREVHPLAARRRPAIARTVARLRDQLVTVPGVTVEGKGLTATVHVRHVPRHRLGAVSAAVESAVADAGPGVTLETGKEVLELRPAVEWDKGAALAAIEDQAGGDWATVYLGDDETDEDAFRAVRPDGVGVLVGRRAGTAATYRLAGQGAVAPFLDRLASERFEG